MASLLTVEWGYPSRRSGLLTSQSALQFVIKGYHGRRREMV